MQYFIVKSESITSYGRTILRGTKIESDRINPDHLAELLQQKAIEAFEEAEQTISYKDLDQE